MLVKICHHYLVLRLKIIQILVIIFRKHYPVNRIITEEDTNKIALFKEDVNPKLYRIETSALGDCLYDSVVFGLLYAKVGKWNNLPGWIPEQTIHF